eukprot:GHRR01029875.1.p1 GENE.GHRR01029875.1~~GHRR01029875.1.p1  ORF type:complete len:110 (-),score=12.36 GHRR01029875.1:98-427(-)
MACSTFRLAPSDAMLMGPGQISNPESSTQNTFCYQSRQHKGVSKVVKARALVPISMECVPGRHHFFHWFRHMTPVAVTAPASATSAIMQTKTTAHKDLPQRVVNGLLIN